MKNTADAARQKMVANLTTQHLRQDEGESYQPGGRLVTPFDVAADPLKFGAAYMFGRKQSPSVRQDETPAKSQADARQRMIDRQRGQHFQQSAPSSPGPASQGPTYRSDAWASKS